MTPELDTLARSSGAGAGREAQIEVEELPRWRRRLTLTVPAERVQRERERITQRLARRLKIPGFRPGHVPAQLVRQRLGGEVEDELVRELLRDVLRQALESRGLQPVAPPVVRSAELEPEGGLRAVAELDVRPELRLERVGGFRVERREESVPPDAVERVLERLREQRAEERAVERPAARGDVVVADVEPLAGEGELVRDYQVRLGSGEAGAEIESQLEGVRPGETREVQAGGRHWRIAAREVRERALPPLDDAFAASISAAGGLAELRERLGENLRLEAAARARAEQRERLVDAVAEANGVEVPESLVDRWVERMLAPAAPDGSPSGGAGGHGRAGHRHSDGEPAEAHTHARTQAETGAVQGAAGADADPEIARILREAAERSLRRLLVVETLARDHGLEPTDEDLERYLTERAEGGRTAADLRRGLERSGRLEELRGHLRADNVYRFLEAQSTLRPTDEGPIAEPTPRKE